jgi:membrane-associated phospholipid phosphatase
MLGEAWRDLRRLAVPALVTWAVMVGLGLLVTRALPDTGFGRWEQGVPRELVEARQGGEVSQSLVLTTLSATPTIVVLTVLGVIVARLLFHRWREPLFIAFAVAGEALVFTLTTLVVKRARPEVPKLDVSPPTSSFPSGHTAAAVCFYGAVAALVLWHSRRGWLRVIVVGVAVVLPLVIGVSRMYRGMHFPTDVLGGLVLGTLWLTTVVVLVMGDDRGGDPRAAAAADRSGVPR